MRIFSFFMLISVTVGVASGQSETAKKTDLYRDNRRNAHCYSGVRRVGIWAPHK